MNRILTALFMCFIFNTAFAQKITRSFNGVSMSKALETIGGMSRDYSITFIYDELEDFTVTTSIVKQSVPDAIRQIIGFYPIRMKMDSTNIFLECVQKQKQKLIGKVVDIKGNPIPYCNVVLMSPKDSAFIIGSVSNEAGDFVIPCNWSQVIIKVSCIGYNTSNKLTGIRNISNVVLQPAKYSLDGIVVKGERTLITRKEDRTVFHADAIDNRESLDATNLLSYVPMVTITSDGSIKLANHEVIIYLNDRRLSSVEIKQLMTSLRASDVERIETQMLHGSEESAESNGGVIYIYTKHKLGFSGSFTGNGALYDHQNYSYYPLVSLFFGTERWNIYGNYYFFDVQNQQYTETTSDFLLTNIHHVQKLTYGYHNKRHNYCVGGMAYLDANKHHNIGVEINGNIQKSNNDSPGVSLLTDSSGTEYDGTSGFSGSNNPQYVNVAATYKWTLDDKGSNLHFLTNYNYQWQKRENDNITRYPKLPSNDVDELNIGRSKLNNISTNLRFQKYFGHGWGIKAGGEYQNTERNNLSEITSRLYASASSRENWRYHENIAAGYAGISKKFSDKIFAMASMRIELTHQKGYDADTDERLLTRDYTDLVPYLYFSHKVNNKFSYEATYTTFVTRPSFRELTNYTERLSDVLSDAGNPNLQREPGKQLDITAVYGKHSLNLSWFGSTNTISEDFEVIDGVTYRRVKNIGKRSYVCGEYSFAGKLFPWCQLNMSFSIGYTHCSPSYNVIDKLWYSGNINSDFMIPKAGTFNVNVSYGSGDIFMNTVTDEYWSTNFSYRQGFIKDHLFLKIGLTDIFGSCPTSSTIKNPMLNYHFYGRSDTRNVNISVTYIINTKSKVRNEQLENENKVKNRM